MKVIQTDKPLAALIGGEPMSGREVEITSPYDDATVGTASWIDSDGVTRAIDAAADAASAVRKLAAYERAAALTAIRDALAEQREAFVRLLAAEAGKPLKAARLEVDRTIFVLQLAAEEATRIGGEMLPLDSLPAGAGRWGLVRRFPLAPISAITPFNFPLLLAVHKIGPAMACGATMVLKPPPQDPLTTLALGELIRDCGYPDGGINIVPCEVDDAAPLITDSRVRMISFTGSARAGWAIKAQSSKKKVMLELGGNAAVIVERDADLKHAAERCVLGGYGYAGQSCISVQRILAHRSVYDGFVAELVERVAALETGDPLDEHTDVGPLIDEASARRAESWIG
ncbi:MAG: aldehyde dehydrogenase family protein, partial [Gemmatimonadales bacterium]